jgi:hypothetical protein
MRATESADTAAERPTPYLLTLTPNCETVDRTVSTRNTGLNRVPQMKKKGPFFNAH